MKELYPNEITFEFDREKLRRYLQTKSWSSWVLGLVFIGFVLGLAFSSQRIDENSGMNAQVILLTFMKGAVIGMAVSVLLATMLHFTFSYLPQKRLAKSIQLRVEGAFLHLSYTSWNHIDRKIHFRSIYDYATIESPLMKRFGVKGLHLNMHNSAAVMLPFICGLKDCEKARDMLAEIDSQRENG